MFFPLLSPPYFQGSLLCIHALRARTGKDGWPSYVSMSLDGLSYVNGVSLRHWADFKVLVSIDTNACDVEKELDGKFSPDAIREVHLLLRREAFRLPN